MDIFIRRVPEQMKDNQLREYLKPALKKLNCLAFHVEKLKNKTCARLTIGDVKLGVLFLERHGTPREAQPRTKPREPLVLWRSILICCKDEKVPDQFLLSALEKEETDRRKRLENPKDGHKKQSSPTISTFRIESLQCGLWEHRENHPSFVFRSFYQDVRQGSLIFGRKSLVLLLNSSGTHRQTHRLDIPYLTVDYIAIGQSHDRTVTFSLFQPPQILRLEDDPADTTGMLQGLTLNRTTSNAVKRIRVGSLHENHVTTSGCCLVYRARLYEASHLAQIQDRLSRTPGAPGSMRWPTSARASDGAFANELRLLETKLESDIYMEIPFSIRFQLQRLAYNSFLSPKQVVSMLQTIYDMSKKYSTPAVVEAMKKVSRTLQFPGPEVDPSDLSNATILNGIWQESKKFVFPGSAWDNAKRHNHLGLIHRLDVTPTGIFLEGPELETKNRVLRKYSSKTDFFIRVAFKDEDGNAIRVPFGVSKEEVYQGRFRQVLTSTIKIAGLGFTFLGFSHSSLREQQCWFMAPFIQDGGLVLGPQIIKGLGDFSTIRCPAKCAARIGQTFSDATDTVVIKTRSIKKMDDIERNGRVFSDGVGTISEKQLRKVWKEFTKTRRQRATLLQIRFQGAKGMLSLDTRLEGECLYLRPSMIKFEGSQDQDLEICGAAFKRLPMYLNRQFVKIMEDLGVPETSFLKLQSEAVARLKQTMTSPINAARHLEVNMVCTTARIPNLIRLLNDLGFHFKEDKFLTDIVDIAALTQLRDIKHRARILVENAATLYGIVDETGVLKPNEIYVAVRDHEGRRDVLLGDAIVTRSPALHPGDIQIVRAVDAPPTSPLNQLHNCVVFSQHGERDLPSMLSGGDLDGDLYNVIFDPILWPKQTYTAAEYPRVAPVELDRPVETSDIMDFFLKFMESDNLGYICNTHLQIADQKEAGTLSPECITLAGMASTAVDFSKTGVAVNMNDFPKSFNRKVRPDFMADAPQLLIDEEIKFEELEEDEDNEVEDAVRALDPDSRKVPYYSSHKILGHLYRAVDTDKFLDDLKRNRAEVNSTSSGNQTLLGKLWDHINQVTRLIQWRHHLTIAHEIRDSYNENLYDTACQFSIHPRLPLSEAEVFSGCILGRSGGIPTKRVRESNISMKEKFDRDVQFIIDRILYGDEEIEERESVIEDTGRYDEDLVDRSEALERSTACLAVALGEEVKSMGRLGIPVSFKYVAAAVCLQQVERFKGRNRRRILRRQGLR